jgi:hypothetical protein
MESIYIKPTKSGLPSISECGGASTNTGYARIISSINGKRKKPIYIPTKGMLSNSDHAWFIIKENEIIVTVSHHQKDFEIKILKVKEIINDKHNCKINVELIEHYEKETQNDYHNSIYLEAIKSAINKSTTYHCRVPFYFYSEIKSVIKSRI